MTAATPRRLFFARVALLLLVAGCTGNPNKGDSVAVLGDSITTLDRTAMGKALGVDYDLVISGNYGKTAAEVLPEAELIGTRDYDQVIINIGSNDALQHLPTKSSMESVRALLANFTSAECIHLVNLNEYMIDLTNGSSAGADAKAFNAALVELADSDERYSIIDWSSETAATLDGRKPETSTLTKDSVHPTEEGNKKLNELYAAALASC